MSIFWICLHQDNKTKEIINEYPGLKEEDIIAAIYSATESVSVEMLTLNYVLQSINYASNILKREEIIELWE